MTNVIVDTVEWDNLRSFAYQWHHKSPTVHVTYSLTKDGKETTVEYQWSPLVDEDTLQYPWLLEQMNGPWILTDVFQKYSNQ